MSAKAKPKPKVAKRASHTREYKIEAIRLSNEGTRSVAEVAADLGLSAEQLYRWRRVFAKSGATSFPGKGNINSADEELVRLKRELKQVKEERDFLKKATAFFAKESR
jgi:transposase